MHEADHLKRFLFLTRQALIGHGGSINHLCRHPTVPYILASASADNSVRLWNVVSSECLAVIGGDVGHKEQVLCVDFSPCGQFLVTGSIDTAVKIWPISSCLQGERGKRIPFIHHPIFSANYLFHSYIDSIKFMGNLLFVKSTTSKIMFIEPVYEKKPIISNFAFSEVQYICDFVFTHGNLWFMRLSISPNGRFLAVGNEIGEIFVWDLRKFNMQNDQDDNVNLPILHCKFSIGSVIPVREIIFCKEYLCFLIIALFWHLPMTRVFINFNCNKRPFYSFIFQAIFSLKSSHRRSCKMHWILRFS